MNIKTFFPFLLSTCFLTSTLSSAATELTFLEASEAALTHDFQYQSERLLFLAEQEKINLSRGKLLPQINLSASYSYEKSDNIYTDEDGGYYDADQPRSSGELNDTIAQISLNQSLINLTDWRLLDASKAGVEAAKFRFYQARQDLLYRTTESYLNALYKAQQVHLNNNILRTLELKLTQAERKSDLGVSDELERLEVAARKDLAKSDLVQAQSTLEEELAKLEVITGVKITPPATWVQSAHRATPQPLTTPREKLLEKATQNNDFRESLARSKEAGLLQKASEAGHYPELSFSLRLMDRQSDDPFRDRSDTTATLNINLPLYSGGQTSASIRQKSAQKQAQQAKTESILDNAKQQISISYARIQNATKKLSALKQSELSSSRYLKAAERGLSLSLRSEVDVLDARTQLLDIQLRLAEALNQYLLADLELKHQTGTLELKHLSFYDSLFNALPDDKTSPISQPEAIR